MKGDFYLFVRIRSGIGQNSPSSNPGCDYNPEQSINTLASYESDRYFSRLRHWKKLKNDADQKAPPLLNSPEIIPL